jgi:DNA polymerase I-like protein with 3'-5' exonuclease and polymerase domains
MTNIAIIDKSPSSVNYSQYFDFPFDIYHLTENAAEKRILKKDITLDIDSIIKEYSKIILVGADAAKHVGKISSVLTFQGHLINDKFIPIVNPSMLTFKPEGKAAFDNAVKNIYDIINGGKIIDHLKLIAIDDENSAEDYLTKVLEEYSDFIALDTETSSFYPRDGYLLGISIAYKEDEGAYISADSINEKVENLLRKISGNPVVFHNAKFDMHFLKYHLNLNFSNFDDTMLLHYCLDETPGTHGLKELALKYANLGDYEKELDTFKRDYCKQNKVKLENFTYDLIPFQTMYKYAATDAVATYRLTRRFYNKVLGSKNLYKVYKNLLLEGTKFLQQIEDNGVPFSKDYLEKAKKEIDIEIEKATKKLYSFDAVHKFEEIHNKIFNTNSPAQLRVVLFDILKLEIPDKKTGTGNISTDAEVLEGINHPLAKLILQIKQLKKIKSTYIDKIILSLDSDNRLRTGFNLSTTTSGRLSSSGKLNMQQLPRDNKIVKKCIAANEGWKIVSQDLKTAEMYIAAALSGDKNLQDIFIQGGDYHGFMAKYKFGLDCHQDEVKLFYPDLRQAAKTVSFEILYKLNYDEEVLKRFPTLKKWLKQMDSQIRENGYVYQFFGRKRRLPNVFSKDKYVANHEVRSGVNALVQGPASDVNLLAAIEMQKYIVNNKMKSRIFALVHDSILAEVPDNEVEHYCKKLKEFTQKDRGLSIPNCPIGVDVGIGNNYAEAG